MPKPKNWPATLPYLTTPLLDKSLDSAHRQFLGTKPAPKPPSAIPTVIATSETPIPNPLVRIQAIQDPGHPANGQYGLFAARDLKPGTWIVAYLGRVHSGAPEATDPRSDYDLWLDRDAGIAVDASREGNEARFVNDYRGVREGPNAEFGTAWCQRWGQLCVGFWVQGSGKARAKGKGKGRQDGIRKGEEILVSYGKGFWDGRRAEDADVDAETHGI